MPKLTVLGVLLQFAMPDYSYTSEQYSHQVSSSGAARAVWQNITKAVAVTTNVLTRIDGDFTVSPFDWIILSLYCFARDL